MTLMVVGLSLLGEGLNEFVNPACGETLEPEIWERRLMRARFPEANLMWHPTSYNGGQCHLQGYSYGYPDISTHLHQPQVLGIDLGEAAIKLGRFTQDGTCLQSLTVTPQPATPAVVVDVMVDAINRSYPTKHCYWRSAPQVQPMHLELPELRLTSLTGSL